MRLFVPEQKHRNRAVLRVDPVKADKRVQRTEQALREALLELMVERGYERLTVQDILDRTGIGRATFYFHYRGKDDLLRRSLDQLRSLLLEQWQSTPGGKSPLGFSLAFFRHIDSHRRLYGAIVGRESGVIVDREMRRLLTALVLESIGAFGSIGKKTSRAELAAEYIVGALMSIVTWWLDCSINLSPEELDSVFQAMTHPALQTIREFPNKGSLVVR